MTIGSKLLKLRLAKGLSQAEVAFNIGIDQSSYSRIESDICEPRASTLINLAKYYKINLDTIFFGLEIDK